MRAHHLSVGLAVFFTITSVLCADIIELSWRPRGEWDALLINGVEIRHKPGDTLSDLGVKLQSAIPKFDSQTVRVTIPPKRDPWPARLPQLPGNLGQIFKALTSSERKVVYWYQGRQLRRYLIRCSSKGTSESPESANYWLDGEFLGNWDKAKGRFSTMQWEDNAIAEILFDCEDLLTASGVGLYLMPELKELFWKHRITANQHSHYRRANDR
jgi:hypothetical protein